MAGSFALAFEDAHEVHGEEYERAVGLLIDFPAAKPTDPEIDRAFAEFNYAEELARVRRELAHSVKYRFDPGFAEDAVGDALVYLFEKHPECFVQPPKTWMGLLYKTATWRLVNTRRDNDRFDSMETMIEGNSEALSRARPARTASIEGVNEDAKYIPPPAPRYRPHWERMQMIGAAQRFRDEHGRPPTAEECRRHHRELGLPPVGQIDREFESFNEFILESGMVPIFTTRTIKWKPLLAARECASFRRRHSYWPGPPEIRRTSNGLPPRGACERFFGGYRAIDIQRGVEAILTPDEILGKVKVRV
jgi:hypothetical protein